MGIFQKINKNLEFLNGKDEDEIPKERRVQEAIMKSQERNAETAMPRPAERKTERDMVRESLVMKDNRNETSKDDEELLKFMEESAPKICVIGAGGSGCNTINRMQEVGIYGARMIAMNTDAQHLLRIRAQNKLLLGKKKTKGLGAGSNPEVGEAAAQESEIDVKELLGEVDLVFVTCGMGGGTGTGSAHVIAKAAKEQGALVIGIVTMPFTSEGKKRMKNAMEGLEKLKKVADTTIAIPNDKLLFYVPDLPLNSAFKAADMVLANAVKGITELITKPGLVNLDFADVRTIISDSGMAMIGLGEVSNDKSKDRILAAAEKALTSPLLDLDVSKATKALINITGGEDMTLGEAEGAVNLVSSRIAPEAHVIWGATVDKNLTDGEVRVLTVLAGIRHEERAQGNRSPVEVTGNEPIDVDFI